MANGVQPGGDVAQDGITQLGGLIADPLGGTIGNTLFGEDIQPPQVEGDVPQIEPVVDLELEKIQAEEAALAQAEQIGAAAAFNAITNLPPGVGEFVADKVGRLVGGIGSIIGGVDDAVYGSVQTAANLFLDDKIDTREERMAMIDYIQDVMPSLAGIPNPGGALGALIGSVDSIESTLKDFSEPLTTRI